MLHYYSHYILLLLIGSKTSQIMYVTSDFTHIGWILIDERHIGCWVILYIHIVFLDIFISLIMFEIILKGVFQGNGKRMNVVRFITLKRK